MQHLRILVAEDDERIRSALVEILSAEGHEVKAASDGCQAEFYLERAAFDLVCLDVMMPGKSGFDVCRKIRENDWQTAVLFITAKADEIDKVVGLELGADDYVVKPFGAKEVLARIHAIMRRRGPSHRAPVQVDALQHADFQMHGLRISPSSLRANADGQSMDLTPREIRLLLRLWQSQGEVVRREDLIRAGWPEGASPQSRTLDQTISNLRKRLSFDATVEPVIETVYGVGYRYDPDG
ncbi:MAG: response regulator transcription factor [Planctomycetota bacterium]